MSAALPDRACKRIPEPTDADGLTRGEWRVRGGIHVWVEHVCPDCGGYLPPHTRCDTCLTWAVKNARDTEWARISRSSRHMVWDIFALQHHLREVA